MGSLADHGGPTETILPAADSPLVGKGANSANLATLPLVFIGTFTPINLWDLQLQTGGSVDLAKLDPKKLQLRPYEREIDLQAMTDQYVTFGHRLEQHIADTAQLCWTALENDKLVLFEGAQGALLDIDHGTYPFVTSSNPVAGAAALGSGVGPKDLDEIWGITKAYATRVGAGPFPTELDDEVGEEIRTKGGEFGTTTGRPRRCGWRSTPRCAPWPSRRGQAPCAPPRACAKAKPVCCPSAWCQSAVNSHAAM